MIYDGIISADEVEFIIRCRLWVKLESRCRDINCQICAIDRRMEWRVLFAKVSFRSRSSHVDDAVWSTSKQHLLNISNRIAFLNNVLICWSEKCPRGRCSFFRIVEQPLAKFQNGIRTWILDFDVRSLKTVVVWSLTPFFCHNDRSVIWSLTPYFDLWVQSCEPQKGSEIWVEDRFEFNINRSIDRNFPMR